MKLGKLTPRVDKRTVKLSSILRVALLPPLPISYDIDSALGVTDSHVFNNSTYGDCVISARAHQTLRFEMFEQKELIPISDADVTSEYFKESGGQDTGLVILDSLNAWRQQGWSAAGKTYSIYAYAAIDWKNHDEVKAAIYLLNGVQAGIALPGDAWTQAFAAFNAGLTWDISNINATTGQLEGHAIDIIAYDAEGVTCMTWGKPQKITWALGDKAIDEAYAIVDNKDRWVDPSFDPVDVVTLGGYLNEITGGEYMVTFTGKVSAQAKGNEVVRIVITSANGGTVSLNAPTDAQGNYSVSYNGSVGVGYKAQASIGEDDAYLAATSEVVSFDITKQARTITLNVG